VRYELGFYIPEDGILHSHRRENIKFYSSFSSPDIIYWHLRLFKYGAPSLTIGWLCNLLVELLLDHPRAIAVDNSPSELTPYLCVAFETKFPFCRLLRLSGLRWRYSNQPPHRLSGIPVSMGNRTQEPIARDTAQTYIALDAAGYGWSPPVMLHMQRINISGSVKAVMPNLKFCA
jgi:hypothetical protein